MITQTALTCKYYLQANTHLAAICKIGDRLELQVRSLEMNGRIIPLALDAYDTDGLQGIYCPETSASKNTTRFFLTRRNIDLIIK